MPADSFALDLLDAESSHVLQSWVLGESETFQLGRSPESDVVITSPYVSRTHACVRQSAEGWELLTISSGGIFVEGQRVANLLLHDGAIFRLAQRGPRLQFRADASLEPHVGEKTISFDPSVTPLFVLDGEQLEREVSQIAEGDYFKELQQRKAQLRARSAIRTVNESTS